MAKVTIDYVLKGALLHSHTLADIIGSAAGNPTNIQFNSAGALDGTDEFTWDGAKVTITGDIEIPSDALGANRTIQVLDQTVNNRPGSPLIIDGADAMGNAPGGTVTISAGHAWDIGGGGFIQMTAGEGGAVSGDGGEFRINAGNGLAGDSDGGDVVIYAGEKSGTGEHGKYRLKQTSAGSFEMILQGTLTADHNYTFPNKDGTFAMTSDLPSTGNLTESTSSVLTIGSGTNAVIGSGTTIQVKKATAAQDGYLASGDFSTFNSKEPALTKGNLTESTSNVLTIGSGTGAVIGSGTTIQVTKADASHDGYLSQGDWGTFNGKEAAGIDLRLDQTSPQSVINGRATFAQGLLLGVSPTVGAFAEGKLYYDATYKTASLNIDTDVNLQIGQETLIRAVNSGGTTINNGEAVYLAGASGVFPTVLKAQANSDTTSFVAGVATQNILAGQEGFITARGVVHDLNTNAWTAGDNLYLSDTVAGGLQNTIPAAPGIESRVGRVIVKDATVGSIYVNPTGLRRLTDLSDVTITTPAVDQILKYNGAEWVNGAPATSSASAGIEFFNATPNITAAGTNNAIAINTLSKTPITTAEQTTTISMASDTVAGVAWLYDTALGRTSIDAGVWDFDTYAAVNSVAAGRVTTVTRQVYSVLPTTGGVTVTITGTLTSRTATASGGTPFSTANIDASATNTTASYLQTPQGLYQITARTSDTVVTIAVPTTYANEAGVTFNVWKKLFGSTSPTITATGINYSLFAHTSTQSAFTITTAHKLGSITFGTSNNTTTVTLTYNGTLHNSHFQTPLITLHGNLAGLQGGTGAVPTEQYYHLTAAEYTGTGSNEFVRKTTPTLVTPILGAATATTINSLKLSEVASNNVLIGGTAGAALTGGGADNVFVGNGVAANSTSTGTTNFNTAIGVSALNNISSGSINTALGAFAALKISTGIKNTAIGENSLSNMDTGDSNIALGYYAGAYETGSNSLYVDNQDRTNTAGDKAKALLYGTFAALAANQTLMVNGVLSTSVVGTSAGNVVTIDGTQPLTNKTINGNTVTSGSGTLTLSTFTVTAAANATISNTNTGDQAAISAWTAISADQTAVVNNGYIINKVGLLLLTLPATSAVGSILEIAGQSSQWAIVQGASQYIVFGNQTSTVGVTGSLANNLAGDCVTMVCIEANKGWMVTSSIGNLVVT